MTSWMRFGMLRAKDVRSVTGGAAHSACTLSHSCVMLLGLGLILLNCFFTYRQRFSIGLRSGDCDGHANNSISGSLSRFMLAVYCLFLFVVCTGALSCCR